MASGTKDPALTQERSSAIASAWLQRHPALDAEFTCDGTTHTGIFSVDVGLTEYGFGVLVEGQTYVQFCLTAPQTSPDEMAAWIVLDDRFSPAT